MAEHRPPVPDELPYNPVRRVRNDGVRLIRAVEDHGFDVTVPSCPGWTLRDLVWHVGEVWDFWGRVVSQRMTTLDEVRTIGEGERPRPADPVLLDWVTAAHTALLSSLVRTPRTQEAWTWTGANRDAAWVRRRMAQETAVHRWDAAHAVGLPYKVPTAVAADGIDEFLTWFAGRREAPGAEPVGGSVHLHCTDTDRVPVDGEWMVSSLDADHGAAFTREHAKGDAAVRGRAHDLLMWLWRRDAGPVDILGDRSVADRFRAFTDLR